MKKYLFIVMMILPALAACVKNDTGGDQGVLTMGAINIFSDRATVQASFAGETQSCGFELYDVGGTFITKADAPKANGSNVFSHEFTELERNTRYQVHPYATDGKGTQYGRTVWFQTLDFVINPMTVLPYEQPASQVPYITAKSATLVARTTSLGNGPLADYPVSNTNTGASDIYSNIQVMEMGAYVWPEGSSFEQATKVTLKKGDFTAITTATGLPANLYIPLQGLVPATTYNAVVYARNGYDIGKGSTSPGRAIQTEALNTGPDGEMYVYTFETRSLSTPALAFTRDSVSNITSSTADFKAVVLDNGYDPDVRYGFKYGPAGGEQKTVYLTNGTVDPDLNTISFSLNVLKLTLSTSYTVEAFACASYGSDEVWSECPVVEFTTNGPSAPSLKPYYNGYHWAIGDPGGKNPNFVLDTVNLSVNVKIQVDVYDNGGADLIPAESGIFCSDNRADLLGGTMEDIVAPKYANAAYNVDSARMYASIAGLQPSTTYYYRAFAQNQYGSFLAPESDISAFRTPVYGGKQYYYDITVYNKNLPNPKLTKLGGRVLVYYEIDPIGLPYNAPTTWMHMFDRNLGASKLPDGYLQDCNDDLNACGYSYAWGRAQPISTPNMHILAAGGALNNYGWRTNQCYQAINSSNNNPWAWGVTDPATNPCPEGYNVPRNTNLTQLMTWLETKEHVPSGGIRLPQAYNWLRLTPTGLRGLADGTTSNDTDKAYVLGADAPNNNPNTSGQFIATSFMVRATDASKGNTNVGTNPASSGAAVRCVRLTNTPNE